MSNAGSNNSGKRKMKDVDAGSAEQSPLPPAVDNQFNHFNLNASLEFASPSNFPPPPNRHRFTAPSNIPSPSNDHRFASMNNFPPFPPVLSNEQHSGTPSHFPPWSNGHHLDSMSNVPPPSNGGHGSQVQQILNAASPTIKPFSFMSLLMDDDEEEDHEDRMVTEMRSQTEQVNQIITLHTDILQQTVGGMLERQQKSIHRAADEQATKKLKQKETEVQIKLAQNEQLERKMEHYKEEWERLSAQMRQLEEQTRSLKLSLDQVYASHRYRNAGLEDSSSSMSIIDPGRVGPTALVCKVCNAQLATMMMWPCRHVSVCKWCDPITNACPVCGMAKRNRLEVQLKLSNGFS